MATYVELSNVGSAAGWNDFTQKVKVATLIKAVSIIQEATPSAARLAWAQSAFNAPDEAGRAVALYCVAANASLSIATILGASDSAIQTAVDTAINKLHA